MVFRLGVCCLGWGLCCLGWGVKVFSLGVVWVDVANMTEDKAAVHDYSSAHRREWKPVTT